MKLSHPRLPLIVPRERLLVELDKATLVRLTTIIAGAGYGKTTLASQWLERLGHPFVWYHLETSDSDLSVFLSYLVAGIKRIYPAFGERTLEHMSSIANITEQSRAVLSTFIGELDELAADELFIALDDFFTINDSPQVMEAMSFLLDHMLPNLHFMIMSRIPLPLDLYRLRARRELLEIEAGDLCFRPEETARLFSEVFGMPLSEEDAGILSRSTEGWVSGQVLFYLAIKGNEGEEVRSAIARLGVTPTASFEFLSKVVYEGQDRRTMDFLTRTSILPRMNPSFCDDLLEIDDSRAILSRLATGRLFTIPLDDAGEWYRYHYCLSAFLKDTFEQNHSLAEIKGLHLKAAALWDKYGEPEQALSHYVEAGCYEEAAQVLELIDADLMRANRISFLDREISRLPWSVLQKHPRLMTRSSQTAVMLGDYHRFESVSLSAAEGFERAGESDKQARSLLGVAAFFLALGRSEEATELVRRARETVPESSPSFYEVLVIENTISAATGQADITDRLLEEILKQADGIEARRIETNLLTWCGVALFVQGRLNRALEILRQADSLPESAGLTHAHPMLYTFLSRIYAYLDRLDEARETAERGIAVGERLGLAPMVFLNRAARAIILAYTGEYDGALDDVAISSAMCKKHEAGPELLFALAFLAEAYVLLGDNYAALKHLQRYESMAGSLHGFQHIAKLSIVACTAPEIGLEKAIEEIEKVIESSRASGPRIVLSLAHVLLIQLKLSACRQDEARELLESYIEEFGEDIVLRLYTTDVEYLLEVFTELFSAGKHLELMERVFTIAGAASLAYLQVLNGCEDRVIAGKASILRERISRRLVTPLEVRLLGAFEVRRGEMTLTSRDWKSKKALGILKHLALKRERGYVPREVLMETFWPGGPAESAQRNLNAALSSLRKTLEPEGSRGQSAYLASNPEGLRLELGNGGRVDLEQFNHRLSQAKEARDAGDFDLYFRSLHEAADLCHGELLSEDVYEEWCRKEREILLNRYVGLMVDLATEHLRRSEGVEALSHLEEAISKDPNREELYRRKMMICSQTGNRAGIEEAYRRCSKHLWDTYEVSPSLETNELYQRLRR